MQVDSDWRDGDLMDVYDSVWWRICGGCIWTLIGSGYLVMVYGCGDDDGAAAARQLVNRTRNSKVLDAKTSN